MKEERTPKAVYLSTGVDDIDRLRRRFEYEELSMKATHNDELSSIGLSRKGKG